MSAFSSANVWDRFNSIRNRGQRTPGNFNSNTNIGQAINSGNIGSLIDSQVEESRRIEGLTDQDRESALSALAGIPTGMTADESGLYGRLTTNTGPSPFELTIQESIRKRMENPEVYSSDDLQNFENSARDSASTAVRDAMQMSAASNARRGVQGGVAQGQEQQLNLEALQSILGLRGDLSFRAAEAKANNLAGAQELGSSFAGGLRNSETDRLGIASNILGGINNRNTDRSRAIADVYASTERELPDYSGFGSLALANIQGQQNIAAQDRLSKILEGQLVLSERAAADDAYLRNKALNLQRNSTQRRLFA